MTKIEWTDESLNVMTGCTPISEGCKNCFAKAMSKRLKGMGQHKYRNEFQPTLHPESFFKVDEWKKPRKIFMNSMSDTFHDDFANIDILHMFDLMACEKRHTFQVLTKRARRLQILDHRITWTDNIWMGVSVELKKYYSRIYQLISTNAKVKFLSLEPLLGPMPDLPLYKIDFVIVGGESGPKSKIRKMELDWARDIRDQCVEQGVKFFYKQGGTLNKCKEVLSGSIENRGMFFLDINVIKHSHKMCGSKGCRYLDGQIWEQMP